MMTLTELSHEIAKALAIYEGKAQQLNDAQSAKETAEVDLIRADSNYKRLRLETTVAKTRIDALREQSYNLRKEASI